MLRAIGLHGTCNGTGSSVQWRSPARCAAGSRGPREHARPITPPNVWIPKQVRTLAGAKLSKLTKQSTKQGEGGLGWRGELSVAASSIPHGNEVGRQCVSGRRNEVMPPEYVRDTPHTYCFADASNQRPEENGTGRRFVSPALQAYTPTSVTSEPSSNGMHRGGRLSITTGRALARLP